MTGSKIAPAALAEVTRASLDQREWLRPFPGEALRELADTARVVARNPLDTHLLHPDDYPLDRKRDFLRGVKDGRRDFRLRD